MDATTAITSTGGAQSATQNPQDIGTPTLVPAANTLQAGGNATNTTNINTSTTVRGIPLSSISTSSVKAAPLPEQPKDSYTPYLISIGLIIIVFAFIGFVASNIATNRRLAID